MHISETNRNKTAIGLRRSSETKHKWKERKSARRNKTGQLRSFVTRRGGRGMTPQKHPFLDRVGAKEVECVQVNHESRIENREGTMGIARTGNRYRAPLARISAKEWRPTVVPVSPSDYWPGSSDLLQPFCEAGQLGVGKEKECRSALPHQKPRKY